MNAWRAAYPVVMLIGISLAIWALRARAGKSGLSESQRAAVGLAAFIGAMLGAKVPFWLTQIDSDLPFAWFADGKTILGGIFGGYLAVEFTKWVMRIHQRTGDQFAVPVAIAVATGRLGCFVAGCCYGEVSSVPWAISYPAIGPELRHPTQLYEFAFHGGFVVILILCERRGVLRERRLTLYLLSYLLYRFLTEWIRPEPVVFMDLTAYQLTCLLLATLLLVNESCQQTLRSPRIDP